MPKNQFTYHEISEKEKQEIKQQAKHLLEKFGSKLEKIKTKHKIGFGKNSGTREEGDGWSTDKEFRDLMLLNAPFTDDDFVVAEKGGWK